jgi:hypothetical protein
MLWDLVEIVLGFYWVLWWYGMSITDAQYSVLGSPNGLVGCQDDILEDLLIKNDQNLPFRCTKY